jgi:DHA2 family multidrug resistance protein
MIVYRAHPGLHRRRHDPRSSRRPSPSSRRPSVPIVSPMIGLVATLAPTIGPTVGGYLSHAFSWHWLFLVNVVPGHHGHHPLPGMLIDFDKPQNSLLKEASTGGAWFRPWPPSWVRWNTCWRKARDQRLVRERRASVFFSSIRDGRRRYRLLLAGASAQDDFRVVDLKAFSQRNFAFGSLFSFVHGHRPLRPDLSLSRSISGASAAMTR